MDKARVPNLASTTTNCRKSIILLVTGITPALNNFFKSMNAAASSQADGAVLQNLIGNFNSLVSQLNSSYQQLENQRNGLNVQVSTTVE